MFNIFKRFQKDPNEDAKLAEYIAKYEQELIAQEQLRFMQFTIAVSNKLFPGDNTAVDRVEQALFDALGEIVPE